MHSHERLIVKFESIYLRSIPVTNSFDGCCNFDLFVHKYPVYTIEQTSS